MSKIKLVLSKQCILSGADQNITHRIKQALTMKNPAYIEAKKHGRWTGKIDKVLTFFEEAKDGSLSFPRGFISGALDITGRNIGFENRRRTLPEIDFKFTGELRPYQERAVQDLVKKDFGVLSAATGSGKTICALSVIATRKQPTLFLVHTKELLYQARDRIAEFLRFEVGLIGDGRFEIKPITVGLIHSVRKHLDELPQCFGQIVIDECAHTPSAMLSEVVKAFDCKYTLGLSATPFRRDGLTKLIYWFVGPLVHKIDPKELQDLGAVLIPEIRTRETGFNYQKLLSLIVTDEDRNNMIVQDVLFEAKRPGTALVVSDRIEHCVVLHDLLKTMPGSGLKVKILTGQLKSKERIALVKNLRNGKVDVVIATIQLVGEGLDIEGLSSLFLATPIKFSGRTIQVIGRILRPMDGKTPRVYDYCDPVGPLYASAKARQKTYREMNWLE